MPDTLLHPVSAAALEERLRQACARVAPLWSLQDFVAVNPFVGLAGQRFEEAAQTLRRVAGQDMLPARALFARAVEEGRIAAADLAAADAVLPDAPRPAPEAGTALVAEVIDRVHGTAWARFAVEEIGKWVAAWADEGQAGWAMPWRDRPLHAAWRAAMRHDRNPEVMGLGGFRAALARLPETPVESIAASLATIGMAPAEAEDYLHRAILSVSGWAGLLRGRGWLDQDTDGVLELLAIRLAWDVTLFTLHTDAAFRDAWRAVVEAPPPPAPDLSADMRLLEAYEGAWRRGLVARLAAPRAAGDTAAVQAVFCIDVRSEVYRRALEAVSPRVETLGFAGFFGFAADYVRFGEARGAAQCPVLLRPGMTVCETVAGASPAETTAILERQGLRRRLSDMWANLRVSAVSCFAYVETAGFASALGLVRGALRRPAPAGDSGLDPEILARLAPDVAPGTWRGRAVGLADEARIGAAETVLRAMSLTEGFGGLVLLAGHGGSTVNNPHAAGLDCGACGGHTGESNARIAAAVLNDPLVREGLAARAIRIPADTWFLAALHDTTTDEVRLFDADRVPPSRTGLLAELRGWLDAASRCARAERAPRLGIGADADVAAEVAARTRDWSEVRPEWALAGNAVFIAAPRARTQGLDLGGRAFLHSYDWTADRGFGVLELIMTAPMVVANWINLQYWGSTVDNAAWGSGNKVLHNVTGLFGVLEGQGGDLRTGLPWQSVHDGTRFVHEPMRLQVFIEAPEAEMDAVLARHEHVRHLVEHGWLHLFSIAEEGRVVRRRIGPGAWVAEAA